MTKGKQIIKKMPILAPPVKGTGRGKILGNPHTKFVRRQTNDQILREYFDKRGLVRLRLQPSVQGANGNYYGWLSGSLTIEGTNVDQASLFIEKLRQAVIDISNELGMTVRTNSVIS